MLVKVISGGQTGVDIAGLVAAQALGIPTGGWMPKGYITLAGKRPAYAGRYGIVALQSPNYPDRTRMNVRGSDATIQLAKNFKARGEQLTTRMILELNKPSLKIDIEKSGITVEAVVEWLNANNVSILNVAGNSEEESPVIESYATGFLTEVFKLANGIK